MFLVQKSRASAREMFSSTGLTEERAKGMDAFYPAPSTRLSFNLFSIVGNQGAFF